jgi:hypothetical protein
VAQHRDATVRRVAIVGCVVLGLAHATGAHPLEVGKLRLDVGAAEIDVSLELDVSSVAKLLGTDAKRIDAEALANATYRLEPIASCTWRRATAAMRERTVTVTDHATCGELLELRWRLPFVTRMSPPFQLLVDAHAFDEEHVVLLDRSMPALALVPGDARLVSLGGYLWKGIDQDWQIPDGIDHLLFLLALLLASGSLLELIGIASGFTVGHTITFALATIGVVHISSSVIQPLIALTVALAAAFAFTAKPLRHGWKIATCVGFIHGFGYANALAALHSSRGHTAKALLGYGLGVVIGQVVIAIAVAPLVLWLHRSARIGRSVIREAAIAIFSVAMYLFVSRL